MAWQVYGFMEPPFILTDVARKALGIPRHDHGRFHGPLPRKRWVADGEKYKVRRLSRGPVPKKGATILGQHDPSFDRDVPRELAYAAHMLGVKRGQLPHDVRDWNASLGPWEGILCGTRHVLFAERRWVRRKNRRDGGEYVPTGRVETVRVSWLDWVPMEPVEVIDEPQQIDPSRDLVFA